MKIWLNGQLVDRAAAAVSVFDHGLLYGDGVFEGIRVYSGRIFQCKRHVDRLFESAAKIRLNMPYSNQQLVDGMQQTVAANGLSEAYIRLVVSRGEGTLGLNPFSCSNATVFIIASTIQMYSKEMYEHGMPVIISKTIRTSKTMLDPSVKSLNYLNNIMAKIECIDAGVSEAIMLNDRGNVTEATGDNVFIVKDGVLMTPPPAAGMLLGVTRAVVMELARKNAITVKEQDIVPQQLMQADECFLTGTAAEVIPVTSVDGSRIGSGEPGAVTRKLIAAFHEFIRKPE